MYKAKENIGEYKIGDEVPDEKAIVWEKMYAKSPVEKVGASDKEEPIKETEEKVAEESGDSKDFMLEDYLGRNTDVVVKNIKEDNLDKKQLDSLLKLEKSGKKRRDVIKAIDKKLKN